jgi:hypothetical protein
LTSHAINCADRTERLAQRPDPDVDPVFDADVFGHPAPQEAEHAGRMGLVDHQDRPVPLGHVGQFLQRGQVAVHAEQAVGDDQPAAVPGCLAEQLVQLAPVGMGPDADVGPGEPASVQQAGVVFPVGEDGVSWPDHCGDTTGVGGKSGGEHQRRLRALELGQPLLQPPVGFRVAGYQRAGPAPPAFLLGRLGHGRR